MRRALPTMVAASLAAFCAAQREPLSALLQPPAGAVATGVLLMDVDGDGRDDLTLLSRDGDEVRRLSVHLRQEKGPAFVLAPSRPPIALTRDVVACTWCDCLPGPGRELLLLTAEQVVVATPEADGDVAYTPLFEHRLVWPAADHRKILPLSKAPLDLDGDGRTDLLLPGPDSWTIYFQDAPDADGKPVFSRTATIALPTIRSAIALDAAEGGLKIDGASLELRLGEAAPGGGDRGPLVDVTTRTPLSRPLDLDGDGRLDVVTLRNRALFALLQTAPGRLESTTCSLPVPEDRIKALDPAFDVQFADLDGDGRAELLLTTSGKRDDEVEVRVDLFHAAAALQWPERTSRLRMQPLARSPQLVDVDGDGDLDLVCVTVRTSALAAVTGAGKDSLDAQLNVFRNDGGKLSSRAMLNQPLALAAGDEALAPPFLIVRPSSKPGRPGDVLLRQGDRVVQRRLVPDGDGLELTEALADVNVPKDADVRPLDAAGDAILIYTDAELHHVRFPR
ncbi:MAG: VCBS repeat-containing protein [Planctomycetes bacterium]|nr:VCBS repeat-containing protein [Planctomycetota bacterium]